MFFKMLMMWMILVSILIAISSNFWLIFWTSLEINLMAFLPILNNKNIANCNSMIMYFVIQSFSSSLFFMSSIMWMIEELNLFLIIINISMMIKLGMIPFHFWIVLMSETVEMNSLMILLTFQKMIPLFILTKSISWIILVFSIISSIFGSLMLMNLKMIRKIMIFSSISHLGWMTILIVIKSKFWIIYLLIYSMILFKIFKNLKNNKIYVFSHFFFKKMSSYEKILLISSMMSLGGVPPFLGFFTKLISILMIIKFSVSISMILIISSLINTYYYTRILLPVLISSKKLVIVFKIKKNLKSIFINFNLTLLIIMMTLLMC
uniref:NADH-ubiquinone oxidoreductase chain 2 n=1 Tax=Bothriocroton undatum TaxID=65642 RepID=H9M735_9ACAR|nr:NADH dehydrogenase subunit 2 [Bothriocroton undatum]AET63052.1 NADH dehydrogenase subunit 2 [Bothriocroton undatum]